MDRTLSTDNHRRALWPGTTRLACGLLAVAALGACSGAPPIVDCEPGAGMTPYCRFQNPEDLVASPSGRFIVVSQFGDLTGARPGSLAAFEPATGRILPLFPDPFRVDPEPGWGDPDCAPPTAAQFSPHGIDLAHLDRGVDALYVINHGGRESVELFEVHEDDNSIALTWRGCVIAPAHGFFNDLVVLNNGDFRVTQMFPRGANVLWTALRMQLTSHSPGYVYHWSPARGFERLAGTDAQFANGIAQSQDERFLFVNSYFGNEVIKVDTLTGTRLGAVKIASPDNSTWSPTGELLVAAHLGSLADTLACQRIETGNCGFRFQIVAIDPDTLASRVLLEHEGPPMGAATVALPFDGALWLGTFAGDRITRVDLNEAI